MSDWDFPTLAYICYVRQSDGAAETMSAVCGT